MSGGRGVLRLDSETFEQPGNGAGDLYLSQIDVMRQAGWTLLALIVIVPGYGFGEPKVHLWADKSIFMWAYPGH